MTEKFCILVIGILMGGTIISALIDLLTGDYLRFSVGVILSLFLYVIFYSMVNIQLILKIK